MSKTSDQIRFAVYPPPDPSLPFLAVAIGTDGQVIAKTFDTAAEAEAYKDNHAAFTADFLWARGKLNS